MKQYAVYCSTHTNVRERLEALKTSNHQFATFVDVRFSARRSPTMHRLRLNLFCSCARHNTACLLPTRVPKGRSRRLPYHANAENLPLPHVAQGTKIERAGQLDWILVFDMVLT